MKVLVVTFSDVAFDGRLRELIRVCRMLGPVTVLERKVLMVIEDSQSQRQLPLKYYCSIHKAKQFYREKGPFDIILADNRLALLPSYFIKRMDPNVFLVSDARELYLMHDVKGLSSKIGCIVERFVLPRSNAVIAANIFRAQFMENFYKLKSPVLIYENLRKLSFGNKTPKDFENTKLAKIFDTEKINVISTSGCLITRGNDQLVYAMKDFQSEAHLFLIGRSPDQDVTRIRRIIQENNIGNVTIIDQVDEATLKYILSRSHIGVVNYHQNDLNNQFCASGKIYEYLFEGLPVLTTRNPPLRELVELNALGVADDHYTQGLRCLIDHFSEFKKSVIAYTECVSIDNNNLKLAESIRERIGVRKK